MALKLRLEEFVRDVQSDTQRNLLLWGVAREWLLRRLDSVVQPVSASARANKAKLHF